MGARERIAIVYVIDFLATRDGVTGGTEKQLVDTIRYLDKYTFRPILICLQEFRKTKDWENLDCEKHILHVYSLMSAKSISALVSFARFLRERQIDIVQAFFFDSILFGFVGAKLGGVRNFISCRRDMGFWQSKSLVSKLRFANKFTTRFLSNSDAVKSDLIKREGVLEEAVDVIHNGIDLRRFESVGNADLREEFGGIGEDDLVVGTVANFNRRVKRLDVFIRAASEVCRETEKVKFVIVGGGRLEGELRQLVQNLRLEKQILFTGVKYEAVSYIKSFDIGVLTSDSEGFSNVILEYMAAGIPTIATDVGGNKELIDNGRTGILVGAGDYQRIATEIWRFLNDDQRRLEIGQAAKQVAEEKYSWEKKIREIESYYISLCTN
jgi:glycosyltransferase involved in cell wall biosynthesis